MVNTNETGLPSYNKAFAFGIALNVLYVLVEAFTGFRINSSALIADAGHNISDVLGLVISWGAAWLSKLKPFGQFTYGLRKTTILASTVNGVLIVIAALFILLETFKKIKHPSEVPGNTMIIVAGIGIFINSITAYLFMKGRNKDLNIKGTFLHMAADAAVSGGVVAGGILINSTGKYWIDPVLSFLITAVILLSAAGLLKDSFRLSVDAVPKGIDIEKVRNYLKNMEGVKDIHDLHIWALSTTETALTAHLVVPENFDNSRINDMIQNIKKEFNIDHSTLQTECPKKKKGHFLHTLYAKS